MTDVAYVRIILRQAVHLDSGDCDLMSGMRENLLPKLGIGSPSNDFYCYAGGTRTKPKFKVAALVPIAPVPPPPVAVTADSRISAPAVD